MTALPRAMPGATICSGVYKPFPFPFAASYDDGEVGRMAKFHADNGGAFEVRADKTAGGAPSSGAGGRHLFQASPRYPAGTQWAGNYDPITSLGATDWVNYAVSAKATPPPPPPLRDPDPQELFLGPRGYSK
jgi:hypothetical protein